MSVFDDLIPRTPDPALKRLRFGTVTATSPLRVQWDGDPGATASTPISLAAGLVVGDRVSGLFHDSRVTVVGVIGQGDTGWVSCTLNSGFTGTLTVRRLGSIVELQAAVDGTFPDGTTDAIGTIPSGFRPTGQHARLGGYVPGAYPCIGYVIASSGTFGITQSSGATRTGYVYLRGMWTIG